MSLSCSELMRHFQAGTLRVGVLGLGYVGLPLACALSRLTKVWGFDVNDDHMAALSQGKDRTGELTDQQMEQLNAIQWCMNVEALNNCHVYVVAVPTPVDRYSQPDFQPLLAASRMVGGVLKPGDVVIYESTVYPGATEEICVPELAQASGLLPNQDFGVGYSPERVNPGKGGRRFEDIVKVTSGSNEEVADFVDRFYQALVPAGTFRAASIRTAEAAKAIENTQRDVNIALMNELANLFGHIDLDTEHVLAAARTKWNFLPFSPGLVGGHCIGVDPYYLIHKATEVGHHPELIMAARRINQAMPELIAARVMKLMASAQKASESGTNRQVLVLGGTFKENCGDVRNSQVQPLVHELRAYGVHVSLHDPWLSASEIISLFDCDPCASLAAVDGAFDAVVLAVAHDEYVGMSHEAIQSLLRPSGVVFDVKRVLPEAATDARL